MKPVPIFPINFQLIEPVTIKHDILSELDVKMEKEQHPSILPCLPVLNFLNKIDPDQPSSYQIVRYCPLSLLDEDVQPLYKNSIQVYKRESKESSILISVGSIEIIKSENDPTIVFKS